MDIREKLIDLIIDAKRTDPETGSFTEYLAAEQKKFLPKRKKKPKKWFGKWFWLKIQTHYLLTRTQEKAKGAANNRLQINQI